MTFEEAMQAMRNGEKVRCLEAIEDYEKVQYYGITIWCYFDLSEKHVFSNNWEIVDD
jgi:hypothetical protein